MYDNIERGEIMEYYTTKQLSEMLQVTEETIRKYIRDGKLGALMFGRDYRISEVDLYNYSETYRKKK
jgi:excisionase family DNA binding protein